MGGLYVYSKILCMRSTGYLTKAQLASCEAMATTKAANRGISYAEAMYLVNPNHPAAVIPTADLDAEIEALFIEADNA